MTRFFRHIHLESVASTNSEMKSMAATLDDNTVISATEQSAGRGQRGNSWEAAPGANVTMSMLLRPQYIRGAEQFYVSQIVALAVADVAEEVLLRCASDYAGRVEVKWPNDIYVDDRKICGILIENTLSGVSMVHSVVGIGLNVNQTVFESDAPNPVSLKQLTGCDYDICEMIELVADRIICLMDKYDRADAAFSELQSAYISRLWRRNSQHVYEDKLTGEIISASIESVAPNGVLSLRLADGTLRSYAFKEVAAVL